MRLARKRRASREEDAEKGWGGGGPSGRCHPRARGGDGKPVHSHKRQARIFVRAIDVIQNSKRFGFGVPSADHHSMMQGEES